MSPCRLKRAIAFIDRNVDDLGHRSRVCPPRSNRSCSLMMNVHCDKWHAPSRVERTLMKSMSLRTAGPVRCRSALGRCRLTRRKNTQPSSPKLGACCAVAQFTCGPARQRGVGAAQPSSKRWHAPAARQSQLRRSAWGSGAGRAVATRCTRRGDPRKCAADSRGCGIVCGGDGDKNLETSRHQ